MIRKQLVDDLDVDRWVAFVVVYFKMEHLPFTRFTTPSALRLTGVDDRRRQGRETSFARTRAASASRFSSTSSLRSSSTATPSRALATPTPCLPPWLRRSPGGIVEFARKRRIDRLVDPYHRRHRTVVARIHRRRLGTVLATARNSRHRADRHYLSRLRGDRKTADLPARASQRVTKLAVGDAVTRAPQKQRVFSPHNDAHDTRVGRRLGRRNSARMPLGFTITIRAYLILSPVLSYGTMGALGL